MASQLFANNATTTTLGQLSTTATQVVVNSSTGFPNTTAGDFFTATLDGGGNYNEIVKVTAVSGNIWTIIRAQENTTAKLWQPGSRIECRVTAGAMSLFAANGSSSNISFIQAGTGAVTRTAQDKMRDIVSIKDFGGAVDGLTDDSTAFVSMVTYCASTGAVGTIPQGTCLVNPYIHTFSGTKPFTIRGAGRGKTTLKSLNTSSSFMYWTGANGVGFENMTIDASFTGLPSAPPSGGTIVFENSNDNFLRHVDIINIYRIACLVFNDHQTTLTNVYGGHVIDDVRIFGPSNAIDGTGPDAFIFADVNNSSITNCYINNIGRFGYEYKNDSNNCLIGHCIAEDVYYPVYFGGDGAHTELSYVKNSLVHDVIVRRAHAGSGINLANYAVDNEVKNVYIDQTGFSGGVQTVYISNNSNGNSVTGITITGRSTVATNISNTSNGNIIEIDLLNDGAFTGRGNTGIANDCANNYIIFKNRDGTQQLYLDSYSFNNNSIIDLKLGREVLANVSKTTVVNGASTGVGYTLDNIGYSPQVDVTGQLGQSGTRWANIYALRATLSGPILLKAPVSSGSASVSQSSTDATMIFTSGSTQTLTLQTASSNSGRLLYVKNTGAGTLISASSNVVPLAGGSAGTAILAAGPGKWATLQSDGTNWIIIAAN